MSRRGGHRATTNAERQLRTLELTKAKAVREKPAPPTPAFTPRRPGKSVATLALAIAAGLMPGRKQ